MEKNRSRENAFGTGVNERGDGLQAQSPAENQPLKNCQRVRGTHPRKEGLLMTALRNFLQWQHPANRPFLLFPFPGGAELLPGEAPAGGPPCSQWHLMPLCILPSDLS